MVSYGTKSILKYIMLFFFFIGKLLEGNEEPVSVMLQKVGITGAIWRDLFISVLVTVAE